MIGLRLAAALSLAAVLSLATARAGSAAGRCPVAASAVSKSFGVPMHLREAPRTGSELCAFAPRRASLAYPALVLYRFPDPKFKAKTLAQMRALYKAYPAADLTRLSGGAFMAETRSAQIFIELYSAHVKADAYFDATYGAKRAVRVMRTVYAGF